MNFNDVPILSIGNSVQLVGAIWQGNGETYALMLPGEDIEVALAHGTAMLPIYKIPMTPEDWKACLRQSDLCAVEVVDGTGKAIVRKCERLVDAALSWRVFRRDGFACRYCGVEDMPLTVDHLIRWEEGGPTIMDNLVACCKKCNRVRGDRSYDEWLDSNDYAARVGGLRKPGVIDLNNALRYKLGKIEKVKHVRSR